MASGYKLAGKLGEGAFGTVYKATHTCALKVIDISSLRDHEKAARKQEWMKKVTDLVKIRGHKNIVEYRHCFVSVVKMWVELEYCNGMTLNDYVIKKEPNTAIKHQFMVEIASGVAFLHSQGVTHGDMKPENIMVCLEDETQPHSKVGDFGFAKIIASLDFEGKLLQYYLSAGAGTEYFMAPEVYDEEHTEKSDVFSIGMICYAMVPYPSWNTIGTKKYLIVECATGKEDVPFGKHIYQSGISLSYSEVFEGDMSQRALKLFDSMIQKQASKRPSAEAVRKTLQSLSPDDLSSPTS